MKIVTWNCNAAFHKKLDNISKLDADIYVIQECENPTYTDHEEYKEWASSFNYLWDGEREDRGLAVFAKKHISIKRIPDEGDCKLFIPVNVNNSFNLLAVWTKQKYIRQIHDYYEDNKELFDQKLVMCGDFNSNKIFDKEHPKSKNHTAFMDIIKKHGLVNCYHYFTNEEQGQETQPTFYMNRRLEKPFHLDHVIASPQIIEDLEILNPNDWIGESDHIPIVFNINDDKFDDIQFLFLQEFYSQLDNSDLDEEFVESLKRLMNSNRLYKSNYNEILEDAFNE